jgi:cytochrome c oxidase cbb3-type subunit 3
VPETLSGQAVSTPSPVSIPAIIYQQHVNAGGVAPPGATLTNPLANDSGAAKSGESLFGAMNCDGCHGGGALGWVGPSLVDGRWRYGGSDGAVFQSIFYGRPRGMPAYGGILPPDAVWRLVSYLRAQPIPKDVPTQSWLVNEPTKSGPARKPTP